MGSLCLFGGSELRGKEGVTRITRIEITQVAAGCAERTSGGNPSLHNQRNTDRHQTGPKVLIHLINGGSVREQIACSGAIASTNCEIVARVFSDETHLMNGRNLRDPSMAAARVARLLIRHPHAPAVVRTATVARRMVWKQAAGCDAAQETKVQRRAAQNPEPGEQSIANDGGHVSLGSCTGGRSHAHLYNHASHQHAINHTHRKAHGSKQKHSKR